MKTKIITILFLVITKLSFGQFQQYIQYISPYLSDSIQSGFFYLNTPNNLQAGTLYQIYRLNAPDLNNNMVLVDQHVDSLAGLTHFKYQQTFMDIPIEGAGCIEHYDQYGSLLFINAKVADSIKKNHEPKITEKEAIISLIEELSRVEDIKFAWESDEWEQQIRLDYGDSSATWYPTSELIWAVDTMKNMTLIIEGSRYSLVYKISITTINPFETFYYYVDANNGTILKFHSSHIHDGPADVYGYGSKIIDTRWEGGFTQKWTLHSNDATRQIHTKKYSNSAWWLVSEIKDADDNWGNTYLTETSTHYNVSKSWDYYKNVFGREGMNGGSAEIRVKTQLNEYNAYFNGSNGFPELVFGKSSTGWDFGMDPSIAAHEFTHGVTSSSSNLQYEYESGALNESFSDIFGVVVQAVMFDGGTTDWIIGNHIPDAPTRSLKNPNSMGTGNLFDASCYSQSTGQPDTYLGLNWYSGTCDVGGVHVNSGVQNKWFYILAKGETDMNDLSNYYAIDGIGITKAARISYYALTSLLMNSSQYSDSRQATIQAAKILYGECSIEHQTTIDAWYAVGIGSLNSCTYTLSISDAETTELLIYPNPTNQFLNIELPYMTNENIQIFDVTGKLVQEFKNNNLAFQSDISLFDDGMYTIRFSINGKEITKRFIVQK